MRRASSVTLPSLRDWQEAAFAFSEPVCVSLCRSCGDFGSQLSVLAARTEQNWRVSDIRLLVRVAGDSVHVTSLCYITISERGVPRRAPAPGSLARRPRAATLGSRVSRTGLHATAFYCTPHRPPAPPPTVAAAPTKYCRRCRDCFLLLIFLACNCN